MLSQKELNKALAKIQERLDTINALYIRKVAAQIAKIGELNPSSIHKLTIMAEITSDAEAVTAALKAATNFTQQEVTALYQAAMRDTYTDPRFIQAFKNAGQAAAAAQQAPQQAQAPQQPQAASQAQIQAGERLVRYTLAVSRQTAQTIENLSNTTAIMQPYREAVDKAVFAVSSGLTSYQMATREALRSIGYNGLQVYYESGYHRRLDTALRQNIIDGTNQIAQNGAKIMGEALGYDAYEISAHAHPAADHAPVQGRVLLKGEYEKMQAGLPFVDIDGHAYAGFRRPIAEWNCMHFAMPFSTKYSKRLYSDEQLATWIAENNAGCEIDGKHYTIYQASQLMRQTETEIRRWKDTANAARIAGNDMLRRQCQAQINALSTKYTQIAAISGLAQRRERMAVEGFKAVRS